MVGRSIDRLIIDSLLSGEAGSGNVQRFTQGGGVVSDVWNAFADDLTAPIRVLLSPAESVASIDMAFELNRCLKAYRSNGEARIGFQMINHNERSDVSVLSSFVAATIYVDELLRVVMPLTKWWSDKRLGRMRYKTETSYPLYEVLREEILLRMKTPEDQGRPARRQRSSENRQDSRAERDFRVIEAAPIAALIGLIRINMGDPLDFKVEDWSARYADQITSAAVEEFRHPLINELKTVLVGSARGQQSDLDPRERESPALIQRVFVDRTATISQNDALSTVKADAASRLFDISCNKVTWAIIDSGIAAHHPAFFDWAAIETRSNVLKDPYEDQPGLFQNRVRRIYDFTLLHQIKSFELIDEPPSATVQPSALSPRKRLLRQLIELQPEHRGRKWQVKARANIKVIAQQLAARLSPDWRLIEHLIRLELDDGENLSSDHGTHVAGTLGADWRLKDQAPLLQGICPDINLVDLRVIPSANATKQTGKSPLEATEFAVVAALEFIQHLNREAGANGPVIHGVNISMSIPHEVRNYGCGSTPVCVASNALVSSGVVVVAAAGNRGWNEQEHGFGNFTFCSITDPGNAHDVITVGSTHRSRPHTYGVSYFSSRGPTGDGRIKPDLVAPGEKIRGPVRGSALQEYDGTSMAAPFVSGAAAMLMARNRELIGDPTKIKKILCETATDLGRERYFQGHGMVDALRALQKQ